MKANIFVLLMVCACFIYGQNPVISDYKYAIKVYNTSLSTQYTWTADVINGNDTIHTDKKYRQRDIFHLSFAVFWKGKNRISHEVELANFSLQNRDSLTKRTNPVINLRGNEQNVLAIALRYELMYRIGKENARFSPIISAGIMPYINYGNMLPHTSLAYPTKFSAVGARVNIIPRLHVKLTDKIFLDINTPINLFDQSIQRYVVKNPSLPLRNQKNSYFNFAPFSGIADMSVRVGVGFRL